MLWNECDTTRGFYSAEHTAATHSKVLTSDECDKEREEKAHRLIRQHSQFRGWESQRGRDTAGEEQIWGLWIQVPDPHGWGETYTISRPGTRGHTSTVSKATPPPQTLHLGSHNPWLEHHVSANWAPKIETSGFLQIPGTVEKSVGSVSSPLLSPHLSQRGSLFPLVLCDTDCFYSIMIMLNTYLGSVRLGPFFSHWSVEKTHQTQGWKTRGRSGLCWVGMVDLKAITAATHLLPIDFLPDLCPLQSIHQVNLPPYSTWMCWKIGIITR